MDKEFWFRRWRKNEIAFHLSDTHHYLQRFYPLLQAPDAGSVFVPLCGKSPDLVWLRGRGLKVSGVELSRTAVEAFFRENNISGEWTTENGLSCCCGGGYKIYCDDFFKLSKAELAGVHALYDRGSLVALPPEMRRSYAALLAALTIPGSRVLLIGYSYAQDETAGPPFSVPQGELQTLFGEAFQLEILAEEDALWSHRGLADRGVSRLDEYAALMTRK